MMKYLKYSFQRFGIHGIQTLIINFQSTFAEDNTKMEGMKLVDVINAVKPTILIGLSGCGGIFNGNISPLLSFLLLEGFEVISIVKTIHDNTMTS
jgi:hypothetical protein